MMFHLLLCAAVYEWESQIAEDYVAGALMHHTNTAPDHKSLGLWAFSVHPEEIINVSVTMFD